MSAPDDWLTMGVSAHSEGDLDASESAFRRAVELCADGSDAHNGSVHVLAQCNLAQLLVLRRTFSDETSAQCLRAVELVESSGGSAEDLVSLLTNYGTALSFAPPITPSGALAAKMEARSAYDRAIAAAAPSAAAGLFAAGLCHEVALDDERFPSVGARDELAAAADAYVAAAQPEVNPADRNIIVGAAMPLLQLAERCAAQGRIEKTVQVLRACASLDPQNMTSVPRSVATNEAQLLFDAERWRESADAFDRALALMAKDEAASGETTTEEDTYAASMHANAATALATIEAYSESNAHFLRAVELFGAATPASVHFTFGSSLLQQNLVVAGAERFEAAAVLDADNAVYHLAAAKALYLLANEAPEAAAAAAAAAGGDGEASAPRRSPLEFATAACRHMAEVIRIHPEDVGEEVLELDELCSACCADLDD